MKKTVLIMALVMAAGQAAVAGETMTQPQSMEYYGRCDVEGCAVAAIHAHDGRVCLPGRGHYGAYGNSGNYESYDNGGNYDNYDNAGNYQGYHHLHHQERYHH